MPIGENAIKRVENNGYSKVQTSCPDMENSVVEEKAPVAEKKPAPKKSAVKSTVIAKPAAFGNENKAGFERVSFGQEMPYWLL